MGLHFQPSSVRKVFPPVGMNAESGNSLAMAREDARFANEAHAQLRNVLRAVGTLFGPSVQEALHQKIEPVVDSQDSAIGRYDAVVMDLAEQLERARTAKTERDQLNGVLTALIRSAMLTEERRDAKRKRSALPDWYEMACSALQVSSSEGLS